MTTYDTAKSEWARGPVTVIASGNRPLGHVYHQQPRFVFYDAPLLSVSKTANIASSPLGPSASFQFSSEISPIASGRFPWCYHVGLILPKPGRFNPILQHFQLLCKQARCRGIEPRWWGYAEPWFFREKVWKLLKRSGSRWIVGDNLQHLSFWMRKWDIEARRKEAIWKAKEGL